MIGQRICGFDITARLGSGAMGEVYRARDSRLGRDVAVKVLPAAFASDPERLARFEREARVLAALNHPHIAGIYSLEHRPDDPSASGRVLVLELVEGVTLDERLAAPPRPSVSEAVALARQLAAALDAAHEKGIVHRDLKPANIKITPGGTVKVLDFGLALFADTAIGAEPPTLTSAGTMLGTPAYMSPEQARGLAVDKRADIWAFGCILFELLAGVHPFAASTVSDTIAAILEREPNWSKLPADTPPAIANLLRHCLAKTVQARLRDIGDAQFTDDAGAAAHAAAAPRPVQFLRLTDSAGLNGSPAFSPDGKMVAFVTAVAGRRQIFVLLLAGGVPLQITRDDVDHEQPRWAPDSSALVYYTPPAEGGAGTVWEISALGGQSRPIIAAAGAADVSHDGRRLAFFRVDGRPQLVTSARDGSDQRVVTDVPVRECGAFVRWSPDDRTLLFHADIDPVFNEQLFIVSSGGGEPQPIVSGGSVRGAAWLPDGSGVVYSSPLGSTVPYPPTWNLRVIRCDGTGERQLTFGDVAYVEPDVHATGRILACRVRSDSDIWRFPVADDAAADAREAVRVTRQTGQSQVPCVSPDGRCFVYLSDSGGHGNLWIAATDGSNARQLTFERDPQVTIGLPIWSPSGRHIVYVQSVHVRGPARADLWLIAPDGRGARRLVEGGFCAAWAADGGAVYYTSVGLSSERTIQRAALDGGPPATVLRANGAAVLSVTSTEIFSAESVVVDYAPYWEVRRGPIDGGRGRPLTRFLMERMAVSRDFANGTLSPDGRYLALPMMDGVSANVWLIDADTGELRRITDFTEPTLIVRRVSWTPDNRWVFAAVASVNGDVILLDGLL